MIKNHNILNPALKIDFYDLYNHKGLQKIDKSFYEFFKEKNSNGYQKFLALKNNKITEKKEIDETLIASAKILEDFLVYLFQVEKENNELRNEHKKLEKIYYVKREFVQRIVSKKYSQSPQDFDYQAFIRDHNFSKDITNLEKEFSDEVFLLLEKGENLNENEKNKFELFSAYAAFALYNLEGKKFHLNGTLFKLPKKIDQENLIDKEKIALNKSERLNSDKPFNLTDQGFNRNQALGEANYCIFCHVQEKDSCRKGIHEKKSADFKIDSLKNKLSGCPLEQKISEMNLLKSEGLSLASLAIAIIDNPLVAGTGHRICNDCMKSCIFQKQDPVDIPQIETETLKDVLNLPYGFEIYCLLTRWNPLNLNNDLAKNKSGKKILVAGLGPAGYTLAHYLLNEGHEVVAIDGLKIDPLDKEISGIDEFGNRHNFKPIKFLSEIYEPLQSRLIHGFGGVAEYGITSRWDKNFLKIIRLLLERRENFRMFGGIRFGSSITDKTAFDEYGFDHVALCIGAGRPNIIDLKHNYAKGIRSSSDFLMSLQLNGAFKDELFTNLQIRLPIIVIGAGLTAVDTACEAQAYYLVQIKKFSEKYKKLSEYFGEEKILENLNEEEKIIAREFLDHEKIRQEFGGEFLIKKYGGTKIVYRKAIQESPAYRHNHEELNKAFEEGIEFIENIHPTEAILDEFKHIKSLKSDEGKIFDCKTLLIAAGTTPNISIVLEDNLNFKLDGKYFEMIDEKGNKLLSSHEPKEQGISVFTKIRSDKKSVSFFGDLHPNFEGNVVKAMASAKFGYKKISEILGEENNSPLAFLDIFKKEFSKKINDEFLVTIKSVTNSSDHVIELVVRAPMLAKATKIGQIFRLQNYASLAKKINNQNLVLEGIAVTALSIDKKKGLISGIVVKTGGSTSLIENFKSGDPAIFMGPSGKPTEIAVNETVVLIGGGRGNMPLTAIAKAYKANGCKIIFFAGYKKNEFVVRQNEMEKNSDILIYAIENEKTNLKLKRATDQQYQGSVVDAIKEYFKDSDEKIDRIFTIGNDKMMAEIARLRHENLVNNFAEAKIAITSLNAPMQCMLKGVCSQCLQKRVNMHGEAEYFYSCANQDQNMDEFDFKHLSMRCEQNSLQEKITKMWIQYLKTNQ